MGLFQAVSFSLSTFPVDGPKHGLDQDLFCASLQYSLPYAVDMRLPTRKSEKERLMNQEVDNFYTPQKIERMKRDLEDLTRNQRRPAAEEVARTAQMGDLSENAAYQFAKQHLRKINDRITMLEERLKHAIPIQQNTVDGKVHIGSTVTVKIGARETTFEILGSSESNPSRGRISHKSPLGAALMGQRIGALIELQTPSGVMTYQLMAIQ